MSQETRMTHRMPKAWIARLLALGCMLVAGPLAGEPAAANPYPAEAARWSEADRQAQRDAGEALRRRIDEAAARGDRHLVVPPGHYRFAHTNDWPAPAHIVLKGIKELTIDFSGSTLWFEKQASAMVISGCDDLVLKNARIDYDPLPFTQGTITAVNPDAGTFDFRVEEGYERVGDRFAAFDGSGLRGMLFDPKTRLIKTAPSGQEGFTVRPFWQDRLPGGDYRVGVSVFHGKPLSAVGFEVGDLVVLWLREGRAFRIEASGRVRFEDVTLHANPFVGFSEGAGRGPTEYTRVRLVPPAGTSRLIASNADGWNSANMEHGPVLEDCEAFGVLDDVVNVHGFYYKVLWQESPTQIIVDRIAWRDRLRDDLEIDFYRLPSTEMAYQGRRRIVRSESLSWLLERDRCLFTQATGWQSGSGGNLPFGKQVQVHRLTLDAPIDIPPQTIAACEAYAGPGAVVRNCRFSNVWGKGMRLQTVRAVIENNTLDMQGPAIVMQSVPGFWGEAANCRDIIVRNNLFAGTAVMESLGAVTVLTPGDPARTRLQENILIEANRFDGPGCAVRVSGARGLRVKANRITAAGELPPPSSPSPDRIIEAGGRIVVDAAPDAVVEGNVLRPAQPQ
jgi:hypothetical protein